MRGTASVGEGALGLVNETALASVKRLDAEVASLREERTLVLGELANLEQYTHGLILSRRNRTAAAFVTGCAVGVLVMAAAVLS